LRREEYEERSTEEKSAGESLRELEADAKAKEKEKI
jgi:hypothetical protein